MRAYEIRHVVGFEETNLVGNVYYVNHLRWQGRCREMFLREHCPQLLQEIERDLALITSRVSCEYLSELTAFDEIAVRMRLKEAVQNRIVMAFEYVRISGAAEQLIARGEQEVVCMRRTDTGLVVTPIPECLREALRPYEV